ncbi:hypothetical protein cypCar_00047087 [Cyprinus carpio]|nr:hypothetical protein cypCar_00047087 [Cyprinus carpio]
MNRDDPDRDRSGHGSAGPEFRRGPPLNDLVQTPTDDGMSPDRIAQVMGQPDRCQHAVHLINDLVQTAQERDGFGGPVGPRGRGRGRGDWNMGTPGGLQEVTYTIPADKCGLVIGKG